MRRPILGITAVAALAAVAIMGGLIAVDAHPGHPQKKLFNARWYQTQLDLTTSYNSAIAPTCDGSYAICSARWNPRIGASLADWNAQPNTARFIADGFFDENEDVVVRVMDEIFDAADLLGVALTWDSAGNFCPLSTCGTFRWGEIWVGDDGHSGVYGTAASRQVTISHELGHLLSLRHESVNADESQLYECGMDNTGPIPVSIMSYDCINPPAVGGSGIVNVQDWDTCGVNHAYYDPNVGYQSAQYPLPRPLPLPPFPRGHAAGETSTAGAHSTSATPRSWRARSCRFRSARTSRART